MDDRTFTWLQEVLRDAEACGRLTNWEDGFLSSLRDRVATYGASTAVSEKAMAVLKRIEEKIYAAG